MIHNVSVVAVGNIVLGSAVQEQVRREDVHPAEHASETAERREKVRRLIGQRAREADIDDRRLDRQGQHDRADNQAAEERRRHRGAHTRRQSPPALSVLHGHQYTDAGGAHRQQAQSERTGGLCR